MSARGGRFAAVVLALGATLLAACGGPAPAKGSAVVLDWYAGPDRADTVALARACTTASDGAYEIRVRQLPADLTARHATVLRRLTAKDTSIDLLSLDSSLTSELSAAQLLAPVPEDLVGSFSAGVGRAALAAASDDGQLVAVPWWFDPQLLWFRGNIAERAGLDTSRPISWDDLVAGAQRLGVTIQIEDRDGSGLSEWVDALVAGAGGTLVRGQGRAAPIGLDSAAGRQAASVVQTYAGAEVGPGPSSGALAAFAGPQGGFLLAPSAVISDSALASVAPDLGWTSYPVIGATSVAPLSGVALAVPLYAPHSTLSYRAISCLTSPSSLRSLMTSSGHSASRLTTYDDPQVAKAYPLAGVTKPAVATGRAVPATPYWQLVRAAIDQTWSPIADVTSGTPRRSQAEARVALAGGLR